jgi:CBS domain-containing protein/uncharacterized protein (DUF2267 family)
MTLRWYRRPRLLVLGENDTALDAARAIEQNRVGAVLIQSQRRVTGIVTDRDLMAKVVGRGLDARNTRLADIMTTPVITLTPADPQAEALRLMSERNVRRIPLVDENGAAVGMVTLDDLILDEAAALDEIAAVVQAQIGAGGPAESDRSPASRRRSARAQNTLGRMVARVRARARFASRDQAEAALRVVLEAVVRRLNAGEAKDLVTQLPSLLGPELLRVPPGPDKSVTREGIVAELAQRLRMDDQAAAAALLAVGGAVAESVSDGQMEDVRGQLPADLRSVFELPEPVEDEPATQ